MEDRGEFIEKNSRCLVLEHKLVKAELRISELEEENRQLKDPRPTQLLTELQSNASRALASIEDPAMGFDKEHAHSIGVIIHFMTDELPKRFREVHRSAQEKFVRELESFSNEVEESGALLRTAEELIHAPYHQANAGERLKMKHQTLAELDKKIRDRRAAEGEDDAPLAENLRGQLVDIADQLTNVSIVLSQLKVVGAGLFYDHASLLSEHLSNSIQEYEDVGGRKPKPAASSQSVAQPKLVSVQPCSRDNQKNAPVGQKRLREEETSVERDRGSMSPSTGRKKNIFNLFGMLGEETE